MKKNRKLYAVSNAHLDTQWNWTIQDTIRDCVKNTLADNFALFEKYPHYRMNFEGAFRYALAKEYYPELYEKLKEYVAQGKWNVSGSQWDATDTNVPSSEAYMRQILLGNGFFEQEFGKKSKDIFLSDCFGFRYSLPSIAAHMGLVGFSTQKLQWGISTPIIHEDGSVTRPMPDENAVRMDLGKWIGPDGNFVIGSLNANDYTLKFEKDPEQRPIHDRKEYTQKIDHNDTYAGVAAHMMYFGTGDYGGSATDESARYLNDAVAQNGDDKDFEVIAGSTEQIFTDLTPEQIDNLPAYKGNLHIPHGFGTLTSHAISKRWNRKCELLADSAERAASVAKWLGTGRYPKERLDFAWKLFLWHQFHDDLPGTSILDAYRFSYNDYVIAQNVLADELTASVDAVASALHTNVPGQPVVVYNPVAASRTDLVTASLPAGAAFARVYTADGTEVPSQVSVDNGERVLKFVATVAPVSFTVYSVVASDTPCSLPTNLSVTENCLENARYKVTINAQGHIASIWDKSCNRELLSAPSALGKREDNNEKWPSWELKYEDTKLPFTNVGGDVTFEIAEQGAATVALKITHKDGVSTFVQTVRLTVGVERVDVENEVEWHERATLLSAGFPLTVSNPTATFDIGLGAEELGNTDSFPYFQHCVHQWADICEPDGSFGIAILNDCKYGMEKPTDDTLRLTLIHTPKAPFKYISGQDWQDQGCNIFKYGFTSHAGNRDGVAIEAECFNNPLFAFAADAHDGKSSCISFASVNDKEVAIRCIKEEQKGNRLIVRVQETAGRDHCGVQLTLAAEILQALETNGYEEGNGSVAFDAHALTFDMTPFSVKTFAIEIRNTQADDVLGTPVALDYNKRVTTSRFDYTAGEFGKGISIPEELFGQTVYSGGLRFALGKAGACNAVLCDGQTVSLPAGTKRVVLLAASRSGDVTVTFGVGDKSVSRKITDFCENVGTWDQVAAGDTAFIKRDPVAISYSHTHDADGDRLYKFANIFAYTIETEGADSITLPAGEQVVLMALTAITNNQKTTVPTAPLYDFVPEKTSPTYTLTSVDMNSSGVYHEGELIRVAAPRCNGNGTFERFGGNADIIWQEDVQALVRIGTEDATIYPIFSDFGTNVVLNKPCRANHSRENLGEYAANALNGDSKSKWAGIAEAADTETGHAAWLEVDLEEVTPIYKWLVLHCGEYEDRNDNTVDYFLQYKQTEDGEWLTADEVWGNRTDMTLREFAPVQARYVRLYIIRPTPHADKTARIYQFHVYSVPEQNGQQQ
ncbi:MAG: discoidin domain-containing protein [Clostridia bacterium]|nr:discoidin domain-containing protein [Clostridia bacterium]